MGDIELTEYFLLNGIIVQKSIMNKTDYPLVSVIVPIYRAESTLRKCIDSILSQTLKEIEIILIDDGSPDQCGTMCDEYSKTDSRIKVIHQINSGVSAARQIGIDSATGEYTIHADPDDWMETNALEELYYFAKENDSDMVICDFFEDIGKKRIYHKQEPNSYDHLEIRKEFLNKLHGSLCNKLIRRSCYLNYSIKLPELYYCEDLYVICSLLHYKLKITYLPKAFYHYVQNPQSISLVKYYDERTYLHDINLIKLFKELFINEPFCRELANQRFTISMIRRAFYYGGGFYTSKLFKERFYDLRFLLKNRVNKKDYFFLYGSCIGFYKFLHKLYKFLLISKRIMKL